MYFRSILSGTLAILLVSGLVVSSATAQAEERVGLLNAIKPDAGGLSLPKIGLPKLFGGKEKLTARSSLRRPAIPASLLSKSRSAHCRAPSKN